ncbi:TPA: hypothetical protein HH295_09365 [Xanthomonas vasicola pv. zeae]|nr:hypothetical protein [Xanthomonas vasicola]MBV6744920.1 hypothetical protein [Xanthomonas vasicola pv. vasculorum NCPPB 890]MBV6890366.1 hypothetical protein [Xanthomonas vasicola pv. vasculorum]MBV7303436.1 hypothetical protein [Xanthomonas vasicola pv. vasculorum]MDO6932950.1 hypothetical protein [Xanthomonas vasicola]MDO6938894.1 hypothetical protein [Xanthomonas vasicola]
MNKRSTSLAIELKPSFIVDMAPSETQAQSNTRLGQGRKQLNVAMQKPLCVALPALKEV